MNTSKDQIVDYTRKKQDQNNPLFKKKAREKCLLVSHFLLFVSVNHFSGDLFGIFRKPGNWSLNWSLIFI